MRLGIDFGTTRIVAAAADRGNFPLVSFDSGDSHFEWFPSLIAIRGPERRYGWQAWQTQGEPGWTLIRSLKRYLDDAGPHTHLDVDGQPILLTELLSGLTTALHQALAAHAGGKEPLDIMLGIPANANSNQRFLTSEAFRQAGFEVLGLLNEPSAASIEFGHREQATGGPTRILVYDLGGGTFDASLVERRASSHTVLATASIPSLGGDDFDHILARMAVGEERLAALPPAALFHLEEECRRQKEALHPNSRRIVIDLDAVQEGLGTATISLADFYEECRPLLERTVELTQNLIAQHEVDVFYVTGGGSQLPTVARVLREVFGRKVKRSEYTRSATAIGLAIQADAATGYTLREVFTRNFGVWREGNAGHTVRFDTIFPAGTRLPAIGEPPIRVVREYSPAHNIGHFRYLEASALNDTGEPSGDIAIWDEVLFPFDPSLSFKPDLNGLPILRSNSAAFHDVEESYECDSTGTASVTIRNLTAKYERRYRLGRWSEKASVVKPGARKRATATASKRTAAP
jgi:molecular chaperone DnaK (HSP70)